MASDSIQCPVCGETMSAYTPYCPSCSFEIHILPNEAPHAVQEMENQRVRYAKNTLLRMKDEISRLNSEIEHKEEEMNSIKTPLEERISTLEDQKRKITEQLNRKQEEVAVLNQQNKKLQEDVATAKAAPKASATVQPLAYLVMTQNDNVSAMRSSGHVLFSSLVVTPTSITGLLKSMPCSCIYWRNFDFSSSVIFSESSRQYVSDFPVRSGFASLRLWSIMFSWVIHSFGILYLKKSRVYALSSPMVYFVDVEKAAKSMVFTVERISMITS